MSSASTNGAGLPSTSTANKRKLSTSAEDGRQSAPPPPPPHSAHVAPGGTPLINYLLKSSPDRLRLIHGDDDTFREVLEMINNYEGVLNSNESLAANLGAKLVGPLLLKSFEKLFEGPITVIQSSYAIQNSPVTWLDIVTHARTNPGDFVLSEGTRSCRFYIKGGQVEISEDDFRLITSGGPERMLPTAPVAEDEAAELSTLNILEARLAMLIKKADSVAGKARQLNYHLKGRKSAITARKATEHSSGDSDTQAFPAVNARSSQPHSNDASRLQAQLLEHYTSLDRRTALPQIRPKGAGNGQESEPRNLSQTPSSLADRNRDIMTKKVEQLNTGDIINPPCDRCRRIGSECRKYLTACQACTRKHARCLWHNVKEGEIDGSQVSMGAQQSTSTQQPISGQSTPTRQRSSVAENGGFDTTLGLFASSTPIQQDSTIRVGQLPLSVPVGARVDNPPEDSKNGTTLAEIANAASVAGPQ